MTTGKGSLARSGSNSVTTSDVVRSDGITSADRIAGAIECSLEVSGWMALAGIAVAIFTMRFALVFFIAMLLVIFRGR